MNSTFETAYGARLNVFGLFTLLSALTLSSCKSGFRFVLGSSTAVIWVAHTTWRFWKDDSAYDLANPRCSRLHGEHFAEADF